MNSPWPLGNVPIHRVGVAAKAGKSLDRVNPVGAFQCADRNCGALLRLAGAMPLVVIPLVLSVGLVAEDRLDPSGAKSPIRFEFRPINFVLEHGETLRKHAPETMAGGVAVFDFDNDLDPDIFFANGAEMPSLEKTDERYWNRLLANDGNANFTDVTEAAGLAGIGFATGVSTGDYNDDGNEDLFVAAVHRYTLYRNEGDGRFTDVTEDAGLSWMDPEHGPLWGVDSAWLDFDGDGHLDLFIVNYLAWDPATERVCDDYCHPKVYPGTPNSLYRNNGDGTFTDVSASVGISRHVGKGMAAAVADFDRDGDPDIFVPNDKMFNFLFLNADGAAFREIAFDAAVALPESGMYISGMGGDFRDWDNDGLADIVFAALEYETFPLFRNTGKGDFEEVTASSGLAAQSKSMAGYAPILADFDDDGWKDLFVSCGHVQSTEEFGGVLNVDQHNAVFKTLPDGRVRALVEESGLASQPPARHRGAAYGDFDRDGRLDIVVTALGAPAELWLNRSPGDHHWIELLLLTPGTEVRIETAGGTQFNHVAPSVGYASSSSVPLHFGLGDHPTVGKIEIRWPSGKTRVMEEVVANRVIDLREN